jgi:hypothetical protein
MKHDRNRREASARPTPEAFIEAWQTSKTLREACTKLGMRRATAKVRALRYRQRGVPLKKHEVDPVVECYPDWEELAEYAASFVAPGEGASAGDADGAAGVDSEQGSGEDASKGRNLAETLA